jgi:hypothetical protein
MKTINRRVQISLRVFSLSAILLTAAFVAGQLKFQGTTAYAGCTIAGKATYLPDGTPACDCVASQSTGTCTCIIKCPSGGGDDGFEIESGGAQ